MLISATWHDYRAIWRKAQEDRQGFLASCRFNAALKARAS
jgi:hypothetical protein